MAPDCQIPFFVRWVERFLRLRKSRPKDVWTDVQKVFLENLSDGQMLDWQIRQAGDAVRLYCDQFLPSTGAEGETPPSSPHSREAALIEMRRLLQLRHYAPRTERAYLGWAHRFFRYLGLPRTTLPMPEDVKTYLSYFATRAKVSASTQNQAFNALLFLFRHVLHIELVDMAATARARRGERLPVVLTKDEVRAILAEMQGKCRFMLELIYGGGLRLNEVMIGAYGPACMASARTRSGGRTTQVLEQRRHLMLERAQGRRCGDEIACASDLLERKARLTEPMGAQGGRHALDAVAQALDLDRILLSDGLRKFGELRRCGLDQLDDYIFDQRLIAFETRQRRGPVKDRRGGRDLGMCTRRGCRGIELPLDRLQQRLGAQRLAHIVIHPDREEALPVALHRVGGHCDDG